MSYVSLAAPDEAQAVEIMCSIGNPHILQEGTYLSMHTRP